MRLLEYEAKNLLKQARLPVPEGGIVTPTTILSPLPLPIVLKSQVPAGGRGKLGGVQIIDTPSAFKHEVTSLFSLDIKGYKPSVLLVEEKLSIQEEHYLSLSIDRASSSIQVMAHKEGGVEVESNSSADFFVASIEKDTAHAVSNDVAMYLGYDASLLVPLVERLLDVFVENDATLLEINPLIYTKEGRFVCGDAKMELDDAAGFRHPEWDFEDTPSNANFVTLDHNGSIATIANGAGLAMATVDAVVSYNMEPANFLDIGGGANTESIVKAFKQIMEFPHVNAIVINIFAGITRCDEVARAIIAANQQLPLLPPLFIRLAGTNFEEAVTILDAEGISTMDSLDACLEAAKEATHA